MAKSPHLKELELPEPLLLGPGPSNFSSAVLGALSKPPLGYMNPSFLQVMADIQTLLRQCFKTSNETTLAISGTGSAAMEAAISNLIEPGDVVLVCIKGYFGKRIVDMARRYGADVRHKEISWGAVFSLEEIESLINEHKPFLVCLVMVETSTGALQDLKAVGKLCHDHGALLLVDAVTGFCTSPLLVDEWEIDACFSCSQKGLSCCPGASPLTMSPRAMQKVAARKTPVANWYLDLGMLMKYWTGSSRVYHHTPPMNLFYALREALRLVVAEGLENVWARHAEAAQYLAVELTRRGIKLLITEEAARSPALTTVRVPDGVNPAEICRKLLEDGVELGAGMGDLQGKVWRVGLMGQNAKKKNVDTLMKLLDKHLRSTGPAQNGDATH